MASGAIGERCAIQSLPISPIDADGVLEFVAWCAPPPPGSYAEFRAGPTVEIEVACRRTADAVVKADYAKKDISTANYTLQQPLGAQPVVNSA